MLKINIIFIFIYLFGSIWFAVNSIYNIQISQLAYYTYIIQYTIINPLHKLTN